MYLVIQHFNEAEQLRYHNVYFLYSIITMHISELVVSFLHKFFFILKAAAEGWRIIYIGGNQFEFYKANINHTQASRDFIDKYKCSLMSSWTN